jgi:SAM-dependent methyltransferase
MHPSCEAFVAYQVARLGPFRRVLEIGSRDINGTIRPLFEESEEYLGVDVLEGQGVDRIIHAADLGGEARFDCVVTVNALEHDPRCAETIAACHRLLRTGGVLILTAAGPGFHRHSGVVESDYLQPGEHYEDITVDKLAGWLAGTGSWRSVDLGETVLDVTAVCVK